MKNLKVFASVNKKFENTSDFQLKSKVNEKWNEQRKISGLTLYIGLNWNSDEHLKELLIRKGYERSNFVTFVKDAKGKDTAKVERVNFDFVLSHMKHSAKIQHTVVDVVNPLPEGAKVSKDGLKMIIPLLTKKDTILVENGKDTTVTTYEETPKVFYTINTILDELRKCEVTSVEIRTILK
jgi:hypothetical protein